MVSTRHSCSGLVLKARFYNFSFPIFLISQLSTIEWRQTKTIRTVSVFPDLIPLLAWWHCESVPSKYYDRNNSDSCVFVFSTAMVKVPWARPLTPVAPAELLSGQRIRLWLYGAASRYEYMELQSGLFCKTDAYTEQNWIKVFKQHPGHLRSLIKQHWL